MRLSIGNLFRRSSVELSRESAVLLIDMQKGFLQEGLPEHKKELIDHQASLLARCATEDIPVVIIEGWPHEYGHTVKRLKRAVEPVPRHFVLTKQRDSAFHNSTLVALLRDQLQASHLLIAGINTSACVLRTAHEAVYNGFSITVAESLIANAHSCYDSQDTENKALRWFSQNGTLVRE